MRRWVISVMLLCGILSNGCTLLKKQSQNRQEELRSETVKQSILQQQLDKWQSIKLRDSTAHTYWIEIWPKGKFSLTMDSGFVGEAEKIRWSGNYTQQLKLNNEVRLQLNHNSQINNQQKQSTRLSLKNKVVEREPLLQSIGFLGLLVGLILIAYAGNKYKRMLNIK